MAASCDVEISRAQAALAGTTNGVGTATST